MDYKVAIKVSKAEAKIMNKAMSLYHEKLADHWMNIQLTQEISDADKKEYENLMYRSLEITQFLMGEVLPKFNEAGAELPSFAKL